MNKGITKNWSTTIEKLTSAFITTFGDLTVEQLNHKPNATTWSIGQVVDHIITVNESYYPIVEKLKAGTYHTPWTARLPFLVKWFGDFILKGRAGTETKNQDLSNLGASTKQSAGGHHDAFCETPKGVDRNDSSL